MMSSEDTQKIAAIVGDYRTRANDANVYLDIMEGRLSGLKAGLTLNKALTLVVPVLLAISVAPLELSSAYEAMWHKTLWGLTTVLGVLIALGFAFDWDSKAIGYRVLIELLRVQQLGFQRQATIVHDNANNTSYTHRLETEKHDLTMGRIAEYVTLQDFKDRAKKLGLAPKPAA